MAELTELTPLPFQGLLGSMHVSPL